MALFAYFIFEYKNYLRQHRYLREIVVVVIFHIFFWGFLYGERAEDQIWIVFFVFAILLNLVTAPSLFFLEKGNTLYFLLSKPDGRQKFLFSKTLLIVCIDLFWVTLFAIIYGLRFLSLNYFLLLPIRLLLMMVLLTLSTSLISLSFTYHPTFSWFIFLLIILGSIVNKPALLPMSTIEDFYKLAVLLLPPFQELTFLATSLSFSTWDWLFLAISLIQASVLIILSYKYILRKDFV